MIEEPEGYVGLALILSMFLGIIFMVTAVIIGFAYPVLGLQCTGLGLLGLVLFLVSMGVMLK